MPKVGLDVRVLLHSNVSTLGHKVERTETATAQFPIWKSFFRPYGQLRAVKVNDYEIVYKKFSISVIT